MVVDLYARKVVGWSMKPTLARELALDALLMALWRRKPKNRVIVHSDQGSQYGSDDWKRRKSASANASIKPATWPGLMCSTTSRFFTTEPDATVTWVALVPRPLNAPRYEAGKCLPERG